ncbi:MAG: heme-degrading monooxygenase HmoA [Gammaproteobacteria bacterium]|jgi:heme-degrading monooxygenase HmoA
MFMAMNRYNITPGIETGFKNIWREHHSYLSGVMGFEAFALLTVGRVEDPEEDDYVPYSSHTVWASHQAFNDWTELDHFRKAHAQTSAPKGTYLGCPNLETFEQVL